jgi:hypothetical protein
LAIIGLFLHSLTHTRFPPHSSRASTLCLSSILETVKEPSGIGAEANGRSFSIRCKSLPNIAPDSRARFTSSTFTAVALSSTSLFHLLLGKERRGRGRREEEERGRSAYFLVGLSFFLYLICFDRPEINSEENGARNWFFVFLIGP